MVSLYSTKEKLISINGYSAYIKVLPVKDKEDSFENGYSVFIEIPFVTKTSAKNMLNEINKLKEE